MPANPNSARMALVTRLARVLLYLRAIHYHWPDVDLMAANLGYSRRTIYRDLECFRAAGLRLTRRDAA